MTPSFLLALCIFLLGYCSWCATAGLPTVSVKRAWSFTTSAAVSGRRNFVQLSFFPAASDDEEHILLFGLDKANIKNGVIAASTNPHVTPKKKKFTNENNGIKERVSGSKNMRGGVAPQAIWGPYILSDMVQPVLVPRSTSSTKEKIKVFGEVDYNKNVFKVRNISQGKHVLATTPFAITKASVTYTTSGTIDTTAATPPLMYIITQSCQSKQAGNMFLQTFDAASVDGKPVHLVQLGGYAKKGKESKENFWCGTPEAAYVSSETVFISNYSAAGNTGELYSVDMETGYVNWKISDLRGGGSPYGFYATGSSHEGGVVVVIVPNAVYGLDLKTGKKNWVKYHTVNTYAFRQGVLYEFSVNGEMMATNCTSGETLWQQYDFNYTATYNAQMCLVAAPPLPSTNPPFFIIWGTVDGDMIVLSSKDGSILNTFKAPYNLWLDMRCHPMHHDEVGFGASSSTVFFVGPGSSTGTEVQKWVIVPYH